MTLSTEIEMEESKKKLKDLKAANEKLTNDITALINTIADGNSLCCLQPVLSDLHSGYAEFEKDKKALLKELEVFQQLVRSAKSALSDHSCLTARGARCVSRAGAGAATHHAAAE